MTSSLFFTSDTHFFHSLAARLRGFSAVEKMNSHLVEQWNSRVKKGDRVYHLGDVSLGTPEETADLLKSLNGQIFLVKGNHDDAATNGKCRSRFVWIKDAEYLKVQRQKIYLHHYACRTWRSSHNGSWHLYGHSHGNLPELDNARCFDVGVDCWGLAPVSFEEVAEKMKGKGFTPVDYHGKPVSAELSENE
jgi:calcineurin-like phosphoesterase family protein